MTSTNHVTRNTQHATRNTSPMSNPTSIPVALSLGSNLGDREANIEKAVDLLAGTLANICCSSFFCSAPVDCPPDAYDFLNIVVTGETGVGPKELLRECQRIEVEMGRPADHGYHEDRIVDIDILLYGDEVIEESGLTIPHAEMTKREFVLQPLAEIAGDWAIPPEGSTVGDCCHILARTTGT